MVFHELHHDRMNIATRAAVTVIAGVIGSRPCLLRLLHGSFVGIVRLSKRGFVGSIRLLLGGAFDIFRLSQGGVAGFYRLVRGVYVGVFRLSIGGFVGIGHRFPARPVGFSRLLQGGFVDSISLRVPRAGFNTRIVVVRLECTRPRQRRQQHAPPTPAPSLTSASSFPPRWKVKVPGSIGA